MVLSRVIHKFQHVLNCRPSQNNKKNIWLDETTEKKKDLLESVAIIHVFSWSFYTSEAKVGYKSHEGNPMKFINVSQAIVDKLSRRSLQSAW